MEPSILLATRGVAKRISRGRRDAKVDPPWAEGYPMEGDRRACLAYLRQLPVMGGASRSNPFGYYQIILDGSVVGGIGFHGPPRDGLVEIGYGVVPSVRGQGLATAALHLILDVAASYDQVRRVCGRTTPDNVASQRVMLASGLEPSGRDPEFLHYEIDIRARTGTKPPGQT
ncbi:MAG TPA: GNAT family N-acetyltransferase [Acidimicrobiales bacterium]|jgi:RimJ/RimL family protein N-acetyltransferase|nr:GNAT family N-acetyltransferase [Acidimicrobiales bacterium]